MGKEKMSIHKALSELKIIDDRIEKAIEAIEPVGIMQKEKLVNNFHKKEDFEKDAIAKFQSVCDLMKRKILIKDAVVHANVGTKIIVAGKEMTIADAINFRSIIDFDKKLIDLLSRKSKHVRSKFIVENEKVNDTALRNAQIMIGKEDEKVKPTDKDVEAIMKPFIDRHEWHLVDPLDVDKKIEKIQAEVDKFEAEIDAALSEVNALTVVEV